MHCVTRPPCERSPPSFPMRRPTPARNHRNSLALRRVVTRLSLAPGLAAVVPIHPCPGALSGPTRAPACPPMVFNVVVAAALVALIAFQVWLTVRVFKSRLYERKQKIWQAQLIWLLPIIGAGVVFSILQEDQKADQPTS